MSLEVLNRVFVRDLRYKEALVSHNAVIYKAQFSKFCLIICAEACLTQQAVSQAIWYACLCISREEPLSRDRAGRFSWMMDNFCLTTCSVVFSSTLLYLPACQPRLCHCTQKVTSSMTTLIILIADDNNCACLAVFDSSLIIRNRTICEPIVLICR